MAYVPDPTDITRPTDADLAETAQAEFRALKAYIAALMGFPAGYNLSTKNLIYNGAFLLDQAFEGALYTVGGSVQTVDGFTGVVSGGGGGVFKVRRLQDPDYTMRNCLEITCTTADAVLPAGSQYALYTIIEAYDIVDLLAGTAAAKQITVSFDMKFSVPGIYGISIRNGSANRSYTGYVTQLVANARESKVVVLTMDTGGVWSGASNGLGLYLTFTLAASATYIGVANTWQAGNLTSVPGQCNFMSSNVNKGYLGRIKLEPGPVVTPWHPDDSNFTKVLQKGQYYASKSYAQGVALGTATGTGACVGHTFNAATGAGGTVEFPVEMRSIPSVIPYNHVTGVNGTWSDAVGAAQVCTVSNVGTKRAGMFINTGNFNYTLGHFYANARLS